jgi:hypothetical protein
MSSFETMWKKSVKDMVQAIKSDNNMRDFFMSFEPNESTGYAWTQNEQYKSYSDILDDKTGRVHSGSSFACCVREAVDSIRSETIVFAEASELNTDITILNVIE